MISLKSPRDIEGMRRAGQITAAARELDSYMLTGGADKKVLVWDLRRPFDAEGSAAAARRARPS